MLQGPILAILKNFAQVRLSPVHCNENIGNHRPGARAAAQNSSTNTNTYRHGHLSPFFSNTFRRSAQVPTVAA